MCTEFWEGTMLESGKLKGIGGDGRIALRTIFGKQILISCDRAS
jgi:hypothetical protein